jgi:hypothetical protein
MSVLGPAAGARREKRRYARTKLALLGRYITSGRAEYPLQTVDISAGGVAVFAPEIGDIGQSVVLYIDELGRLEGEIVRHIEGGFAVKVNATPARRDRLADQITWLANRALFDKNDGRHNDRVVPANPASKITFANGHELMVNVLEVSLSGATIECEIAPQEGEIVIVGATKGRVLRVQGEFFAMEFVRLLPAATFDESVRL